MMTPTVEITGTHHGYLEGSATNANWTQLTSASLGDLQSTANPAAALPASLWFSWLAITNRHATQSLYVADAAVTAGHAQPGGRMIILPGETREISYTGRGGGVQTISVGASGAATTYTLDAYLTLARV